MKKKSKTTDKKKPITHQLIFKIMLWVTYSVAGAFLIINIIKLNLPGIIAIGSAMLLLTGVIFFMHNRKMNTTTQEFVLAIGLEVMVFSISLFSGDCYSDDFPMFLAVIAMTGMYMEPHFTKVQIIVADVLLALMYIINPQKAESLTQYILCFAIFTLAGFLMMLAIKRGRAFIDLSREQAEKSENILWDMRKMGNKIQQDFDDSSSTINESTSMLRKDSAAIIENASAVADSCDEIRVKVDTTSEQIKELNFQLKRFEEALANNRSNMNAMKEQLRSSISGIEHTYNSVTAMKTQMNEIAEIAEQLGDISLKTTLLSLNAAIEASHAGAAGAGFAVVASEMKALSEHSERFADRVTQVVTSLLMQVNNISEEFEKNTQEIELSEVTMSGLQDSFGQLNNRFSSLYENIEIQNESVGAVSSVFGQLKDNVDEMMSKSAENKDTVEQIASAMDTYRDNIGRIVMNTRSKT